MFTFVTVGQTKACPGLESLLPSTNYAQSNRFLCHVIFGPARKEKASKSIIRCSEKLHKLR